MWSANHFCSIEGFFFIPLLSAKAFFIPPAEPGVVFGTTNRKPPFSIRKAVVFPLDRYPQNSKTGFSPPCRLLTNLSKRKRSAYTKAILPSLCVLFSSLKNTGAALPVAPVTLMYSADYFDIKMIRINKKAPTFQSRLLCFLVPPSLSGGVSLSASTHAA